VHIFFDVNDVRNYYIPVDPSFMHSVKELAPAVDIKLVDLLDALETDPVTDEERTIVLKNLISQVTYIQQPGQNVSLLKSNEKKAGFGSKIKDFLNKDLTATNNPRKKLSFRMSRRPPTGGLS